MAFGQGHNTSLHAGQNICVSNNVVGNPVPARVCVLPDPMLAP